MTTRLTFVPHASSRCDVCGDRPEGEVIGIRARPRCSFNVCFECVREMTQHAAVMVRLRSSDTVVT